MYVATTFVSLYMSIENLAPSSREPARRPVLEYGVLREPGDNARDRAHEAGARDDTGRGRGRSSQGRHQLLERTDATLVDDMAPRPTYSRPLSSLLQSATCLGSVLGKRSRDVDAGMDVDAEPSVASPKESAEAAKMVASPVEQSQDATEFIEDAIASSSKLPPSATSPDVEMKDASLVSKAPPLPPRKPRGTDESVMMFGTSSRFSALFVY